MLLRTRLQNFMAQGQGERRQDAMVQKRVKRKKICQQQIAYSKPSMHQVCFALV